MIIFKENSRAQLFREKKNDNRLKSKRKIARVPEEKYLGDELRIG